MPLWGDNWTPRGGVFGEQDMTPQKDARLAFASQLLAGSGGNQGNFSEIMGKALLASREARMQTQQMQAQKAQQDQEMQLRQQQIANQTAQANRPPEDPAEIRTLRMLQSDPELMKLYQQMNAGKQSTPASIQEWEFFQKLPDDAKAQYLNMKRQPAAPQLAEIGGVPTLVDRVNQTQTPLSTLQQEAAARGTLAEGQAVGQKRGEVSGEIQKKGVAALSSNDTIDLANSLIDVATGSAAGAARDKVVGLLGYAPKGAQATAELKVLQANLMANMPRMEGPQSDRDVQLYREASGQIGDPSVPREIKKSAVRMIRQLNDKYIQRGSAASSAPVGGAWKIEPVQ